MINAIIIDDEIRSIELLEQLIQKYCPDIKVLGTCMNIEEAYMQILSKSPELIFLDVDMPPNTGFELLSKFDHLPFEVIFVTAFDHYAIDAIKFSALYYILKPIRIYDLKDAILKAKEKITRNEITESGFITQILQSPHEIKRVVINSQNGSDVIDLDCIVHIEADNSYSIFHLIDHRKIVSTRSIKEYELMLQDKGFFRVHKSYIVNLNFVQSVDKTDGNEIILKNHQKIPLALRRKEDFMKLL